MRKLILFLALAAIPICGRCDDEGEDSLDWYARALHEQDLDWQRYWQARHQEEFQNQLLDDLDSIRRDLDEVTPQ